MNKKLFIRCDFSEHIGFGHLKRMLVLAKCFKNLNYDIKIFYKETKLSRDIFNLNFSSCFNSIVYEEEFINNLIIENPDVCILDLHSQDRYKFILKKFTKKLNNIKLICFDYSKEIEKLSYLCVVPFPYMKNISTKVLNGFNYQIFSEDLYYFSKKIKNKNKNKDNNVLISLGGSDPNNFSYKVLKNLIRLKYKLKYIVIVGPLFKNKNKRMINILSKNQPNVTVVDKPTKLGKYYFMSDLVISSGGQSKFEAALFKKPNFIIPNTQIEKKYSLMFSKINSLSYVQKQNFLTKFNFEKQFKKFINKFCQKKFEYFQLKTLFDGKEVSRIVKKIVK